MGVICGEEKVAELNRILNQNANTILKKMTQLAK